MKKVNNFIIFTLIIVALFGCKKQQTDIRKNVTVDSNATYIDGIKDDDLPLVVSDYGPKETMPLVMTDSEIWVVFSKPMVPLAKLGEVITESVFTIEPPVRGVFRWYGSRMVSFIPEEPLKPATAYNIVIKDTCKSLSGTPFTDNKKTFPFKTELLSVEKVTPSSQNVSIENSRNIIMTFNMPIDVATVAKYIEVTYENNNRVLTNLDFDYEIPTKAKYKNYEETLLERMIVLHIKGDIPLNKQINVTLLSSAKPTANSLGTEKEYKRSFHTLKPFELVEIYNSPYNKYDYDDPRFATFEFSQPVDPKEIEKYIFVSLPGIDISKYVSVDPAPLYAGDGEHELWSSYGLCVRLANLPIEYNSSYQVIIKKGLKDIYGQELERTISKEIDVGDAEQLVKISDLGNKILESDYGQKYAIATQNVFTGKMIIESNKGPFYEGYKAKDLQPFTALADLPKNQLCKTTFDLTPYLNSSGKGTVNMAWDIGPNEGEPYNINSLNLQVTNLGVSVRYCSRKFVVMVATLNSAEPVENAVVYIKNKKEEVITSGTTDNQGLAIIDFTAEHFKQLYGTDDNDYYRPVIVQAVKDDDQVSCKIDNTWTHNIWKFGVYTTKEPRYINKPIPAVFMFTDRRLYKPGETVTFKGVDRSIVKGKFEVYNGVCKLRVWSGMDNTEFYEKNIKLTELGTFSDSFTLPDNVKPGFYYIEYMRSGDKYPIQTETFQIAEFRKVAFSVKNNIPDVLWYQGDKILASVNANYLAGGMLKSFDVNYYWSREGHTFTAPVEKFAKFKYGPRNNYLWSSLSSGNEKGSGGSWSSSQSATSFAEGQPYLYHLSANVTDIDRQSIGSFAQTVVHPAAFYIGAKITGQEDYYTCFVEKNKEFVVDLVTITPDGQPYNQSEKISCQLVRTEWTTVKQQGIGGRVQINYTEKETVEKELTVNTAKSIAQARFKPEKAGSYKIIFRSKDKKSRAVRTDIELYSTGSDWILWGEGASVDIDMVTDKTVYQPGDTANILVKSPLKSGKYLLTVEREDIIEQKVIDLEGSANVVPININEDYIPHVYVALTSYSGRTDAPPTKQDELDLGKPKGYFGITELKVDVKSKTINLAITKDKNSYRPGDKVSVKIKATYKNKPVPNAEITYLAADRGVLDVINYHIADPINFFYALGHFPLGVRGGDSRDDLISPVTYEFENLLGGDGENKSKVRKDFRPTAVFLPTLVTDENGEVTADFTLPDNLTTYRQTAFAVTEENFGLNEDEILVSNPINVRTSLPRKLRIGDKSVSGVVVTNLSGRSENVTVTCESDLLSVTNPTKNVTIADGETAEVTFDINAGNKSGKANLSFKISSNILNETLEDKLDIQEPIVKESFTINGKTDDKYTEGLQIPVGVNQKEGGLSINLDSTRLAMLGRAFKYLNEYPYDCLEQRVSRLFPLVIFGRYAANFGIEAPNGTSYNAQIEAFLKELSKYQRSNGGFAYWPKGDGKPSYYLSVRVYHLLICAREAGFALPKNVDFNMLRAFVKTGYVNNKWLNDFDKAYCNFVLSLDGQDVRTKLGMFQIENNSYSLATLSLLALTYSNCNDDNTARRIFTTLSNYVRIGTQTVDITEPTNASNNYFWSEETDLALILMCYNKFRPESMVLDNIIRTIFQRSSQGYWRDTHTTGWILYAFGDYFATESGSKTDFNATVTLGGNEIIKHEFKGINTNLYYFDVDMPNLQSIKNDGLLPLTFHKKGEGTLFYTATLTYALDIPNIKARDEGIGVFGEITDAEGNKYNLTNGLKLGKNYRYKVNISSNRERDFVAVRVPIPAGAEPIDGSFATSVRMLPETDKKGDSDSNEWWSPRPVQTIFDNEVQFFIDRLKKGKTTVEFQFRTTSSGLYNTPPITAECMYEPEVFGRTSGVAVDIK